MQKKQILGYVLGGLIALALFAPVFTHNVATVHAAPAASGALTADELFGGTDAVAVDFAAEAGLGSAELQTTIARIIRVFLSFLGIVAVAIITLGGFKWMTAGGNEDKVKEAKRLMIQGVIGIVIVVSAFAIAQFVITQIAGVTTA